MGLLPRTLAGLLVERVIYKVNSFQFTRSARLLLALHRNAKYAYLGATRCSQIPPWGRHINSLLVEPVGQSSEPFGQPEIPMTYKTLTESKAATIMPRWLQASGNYNPFAIAGRSVARKEGWEWAWGDPLGAFHPPR